MSEKTFIVNKTSFQEEFLLALTKFKPTCEFLPVHYIDGNLVLFCHHKVVENTKIKGTIAMYIEYKPESSTLEEGSTFYIKNPTVFSNQFKLLTSERVSFTLSASHLIAQCDVRKMQSRLYDPLLASKDRTFYNPKKFDLFRSKFVGGINLTKAQVMDVKKMCKSVRGDNAELIKGDGKTLMYVGCRDNDSYEFEIEGCDAFSDKSIFPKDLFAVVSDNDIIFSETTCNKLMTIIDKTDNSTKYCFVTRIDGK